MHAIFAADVQFENWMLALRTPLGVKLAEVVTFFGNTTTVIALAVVIALILVRRRAYWPQIIGLGVTLVGAAGTALVLKDVVVRARPGAVFQAIAETGYSFPSWHATGSVAFYGFVAYLLCRTYPAYRNVTIAVAVIAALLIGFSRVYLGVHFPSDVIGGYAVGALWLLLGIRAVRSGYLTNTSN